MGKRNLPVKTKFSVEIAIWWIKSSTFLSPVHFPFPCKMPLESRGEGNWLRHQKFPVCSHVAKIKHKQEVPPPPPPTSFWAESSLKYSILLHFENSQIWSTWNKVNSHNKIMGIVNSPHSSDMHLARKIPITTKLQSFITVLLFPTLTPMPKKGEKTPSPDNQNKLLLHLPATGWVKTHTVLVETSKCFI